jgi:7-cyano-7-deazaguanine synthase
MPMHGKKVVVCLSGGMDSTTLLYHAITEGAHVLPLSINYGQRHERELWAAQDVVVEARLRWEAKVLPMVEVNLRDLKRVMLGSSQTDERVAVPEGHYTDESMKATVVPNRNMLLLGVATAYAISHKADHVGYAAHAGDHPIYPDCRPEFVAALSQAIALCDAAPPTLWAPFVNYTKAQIATYGQQIGVPYHMTWSCYKGRDVHCGKCGTCVERREAFQLAGKGDPTLYE